ncbi:MAG: hypothetical protein AB8G15_13485 [Saprospiraceae bacterium]
MNNKLSLASILGFILSSWAILATAVFFWIKEEIEKQSFAGPEHDYFLYGTFSIMVILIVLAVGFFFKSNWARVGLLWIFYLALAILTLAVGFNFSEISNRGSQLGFALGSSAFGYCFLLAGILLLHNDTLKKEFIPAMEEV